MERLLKQLPEAGFDMNPRPQHFGHGPLDYVERGTGCNTERSGVHGEVLVFEAPKGRYDNEEVSPICRAQIQAKSA
jgi:hypothetical protein